VRDNLSGRTRFIAVVGALAIVWFSAPWPAQAAFPGGNGRIAFGSWNTSKYTRTIWTMKPDGSDRRELAGTNVDQQPAWSANGTKLAFAHQGNGADEIWTANADGSVRRQVTSNPYVNSRAPQDGDPAWSPDGKRIAFDRIDDTRSGYVQLWVMNADGTGQTDLTNSTTYGDSRPQWSPDGKHIAFESQSSNGGSGMTNSVATMTPDGKNRRVLASGAVGPSWSPDGTRIAFTKGQSPSSAIWTMKPDGSDQRQIKAGGGYDYGAPKWSPDGSRIAYLLVQNQHGTRIDTMRPDGSGDVALTRFTDDPNPFDEDWQPLPRPVTATPSPTTSPASNINTGSSPTSTHAAGSKPTKSSASSTPGPTGSASSPAVPSASAQAAPFNGSVQSSGPRHKSTWLYIVGGVLGVGAVGGGVALLLIRRARAAPWGGV